MKPITIVGMTGAGKTYLLGIFEEYTKEHNIPYIKQDEIFYMHAPTEHQLPKFEDIIKQRHPDRPFLLLIDTLCRLLRLFPDTWEETIKPALLEGEKFNIVPVLAVQRLDLLPEEIRKLLFTKGHVVTLPMVTSDIYENLPYSDDIKRRIAYLTNWDAIIIHHSGVVIETKNRQIIPNIFFETKISRLKEAKFRENAF
jgi:hypothetical protein